MNVVLDTNILISALGWPNGNEAKILNLCYAKKLVLLMSPDLIEEFYDVASRPKLGFVLSEIEDFIASILEICKFINPQEKIEIIQDDSDNRLLELAYEGKSDLIITGDEHLLKLGEFKGIKVLRSIDFLKSF